MKAPPMTRRRMTPPTPMQNSYTSFERDQGSYEEEGKGWKCEGEGGRIGRIAGTRRC